MPLPYRLGAYYFAFFVHAAVFVAYFPLYLAQRGLDPVEIAWVLAMPPLARTFAPAFWGWLADRAGAHRAIVVMSCTVSALGFAALPFVQQIALLILLMSVLAAGALPLVEAITLGSLAGQAGRYGPIRMWGSIGFIAAVLAGGAWLDLGPVTVLPAVCAACMFAALLAALVLPSGAKPARHERSAFAIGPEARALLASGFCMAVAHGALYAFLSVHLESLGYSGTVIGMLWALGVVAEIAVFLWLPQLFRRYALSTILIASLLCGAARFVAIGWASELLWIVLIAQVLHAATFGAFHAASVAAVHRVFPQGAHGRAQTVFSSLTYGAGGAVGTVLSGWAWGAGGAPAAFTFAALACASGAIFSLRLQRAGL